MKITILSDKSSYINSYHNLFIKQFEQLGHSVKIIHNVNDLTKGDVAFFLSCFEIVSEEKLALNKNNIVIHESDLPKGKGWSPASWSIINGEDKLTLTLFEAAKKCDAGDIYFKDIISLSGNELVNEWREKIIHKKLEMSIKFLKNYEYYIRNSMPQSSLNIQESFYPKRTKDSNKIDINKTIKEQFNLFRIADNEQYPVFFEYCGEKYELKIYKRKNWDRKSVNEVM